jgi:hypothetical protein
MPSTASRAVQLGKVMASGRCRTVYLALRRRNFIPHIRMGGPFTQCRFFTKAALLTFRGAYAVLPYAYHGAVEHYLWITLGK